MPATFAAIGSTDGLAAMPFIWTAFPMVVSTGIPIMTRATPVLFRTVPGLPTIVAVPVAPHVEADQRQARLCAILRQERRLIVIDDLQPDTCRPSPHAAAGAVHHDVAPAPSRQAAIDFRRCSRRQGCDHRVVLIRPGAQVGTADDITRRGAGGMCKADKSGGDQRPHQVPIKHHNSRHPEA